MYYIILAHPSIIGMLVFILHIWVSASHIYFKINILIICYAGFLCFSRKTVYLASHFCHLVVLPVTCTDKTVHI